MPTKLTPWVTTWMQNICKTHYDRNSNYQKPPQAYVVNIYGINLFNFLNSYTKDVIIYVLRVFGLGINVDMGHKTIGKTQPTLDLLNKYA